MLTINDVKHIAKLSRIELTDEEVTKFQHQLSAVIEYIAQLNELNTDDVEPTINTTGIENRTREDIVQTSFSNEESLKNASQTSNGYFLVPNVFE